MTLLIQYTMLYAAILFLAATGGCFSERSGVLNLAVEGIMVMGALGGALALKFTAGLAPGLVVVIVAATSILFGMLYSLLLAVPSIRLGVDQTLVGIALNMLAASFATIYVRTLNSLIENNNEAIIRYIHEKTPLMLNIGKLRLNVFFIFAVFLLIVSVFVMNYTKFGLQLCACGENPLSAASAGINVRRKRYQGVLISGIFGGISGIAYIISGVSEWSFDKGVAGFGFLALAVMIFGKWKPLNIALGALIFGFFRALSNVYAGFDWLLALDLPSGFYNILPYLISLLILIFASEKSTAPKSLGIPYNGNTE